MRSSHNSTTINVTINGKAESILNNITVSELLILKEIPQQHVAIVVNDTVVPRSRWNHIVCQHNDNINVFSAVAGG
ncbi:sulfur carrier protein ThiS [Shewanella basaltis]|uniref:sulfur carrier protein ThiS n=1 Tax=Shewanella basaltis TaxID=472183 RepID=UPI003AAE270F